MATSYGYSNGEPGWTASISTIEANIFWGTDPTKNVQYGMASILAATVDAGNTPTTLLRQGLILGKITATGLYTVYSPTATDGSQQAVGVLPQEINMLDPVTGSTAIRVSPIVITGPLRADALVNLDNVARKQLRIQGVIFDDERTQGAIVNWVRELNKATDYTVTAADSGTLFTASAAVNFTLPTIAAGLSFSFLNLADSNMAITSAAGNDIVTDGDAAASSITFSTSSHKIGGWVDIIANAAGTKWYASNRSAGATVLTIA